MARRMVVLGLDGAEPTLVFDRFQSDLPNLSRLAAAGLSGPLNSVIPAITVPAWACSLSGKDPGELGIYGFRNRKDYSYDGLRIANSTALTHPLAPELLKASGRKVIMQGVPPSYPLRPIGDAVIGCFLTPSENSEYAYPPTLKQEIAGLVGEYPFDVTDFRSDDKRRIIDQVYVMTEKHFQVFRHLLRTREWDFAMMHEIGVDRMHHGFWRFADETHAKYEPGNPYQNAIRDYYRFVDKQIGLLVEDLPPGVDILVMSDHGGKKMVGGVCINEWLMREKLLALKEAPAPRSRFDVSMVDWSRTKVWGEGGYYARLFFNREGREPQGIVKDGEYEELRRQIATRLEAMEDEQGRPLGTKCFYPEKIYRECRNIPPDLLVYFGDLNWRSVGSVGMDSVYTYENDTGPDDANHAQEGLFVLAGDGIPSGKYERADILQIAPTIMSRVGAAVPESMAALATIVHAP